MLTLCVYSTYTPLSEIMFTCIYRNSKSSSIIRTYVRIGTCVRYCYICINVKIKFKIFDNFFCCFFFLLLSVLLITKASASRKRKQNI